MQVTDGDHAITTGLAPFTVFDERYSHLERSPSAHVLLHHDHELQSTTVCATCGERVRGADVHRRANAPTA